MTAIIWNPRAGSSGDDQYRYTIDGRIICGEPLNNYWLGNPPPTPEEVNTYTAYEQIVTEAIRQGARSWFSLNLDIGYHCYFYKPYIRRPVKFQKIIATLMSAIQSDLDIVRLYRNKPPYSYPRIPVAGDRILNDDIMHLRKALAEELFPASWITFRSAYDDQVAGRKSVCVLGCTTPSTWTGVPGFFDDAVGSFMFPDVLLIANGRVYTTHGYYTDTTCQSFVNYTFSVQPLYKVLDTIVKNGTSLWGQRSYLYKSTDNGENWIDQGLFPNFYQDGQEWRDPGLRNLNLLRMNSGRLAVTGWARQVAAPQRTDIAFWYSDDDGVSWLGRRITLGPYINPQRAYLIFEIDGLLYVIYEGANEAWRRQSSDGGYTWSNATQMAQRPLQNCPNVWAFSGGVIVTQQITSYWPYTATLRSINYGSSWTDIGVTLGIGAACRVGNTLSALRIVTGEPYFYFSQSYDGGVTWTNVYQTNISVDRWYNYPGGRTAEWTRCTSLSTEGATCY